MLSVRTQSRLNSKVETRKIFFLIIRFLQKQKLPKNFKLSYQIFLNKIIKKNYFSHKKNICLNTKRTKGIYTFLRLARTQIKELFATRELLGFLRSSW